MTTPIIVSAVIAAVNAGDTTGFLDLFTETGTVDDWGSVYRGRQEIKSWSDRELIGVNARFELRSSEQHGSEASMLVNVGGDGFNGPSRFTFTISGGRIAEMRIVGGDE
jgi:hypothetical protein